MDWINKYLNEQEVEFKAKKIIDYPGFRQSTKYSCGASAVQSALIYCFGNKYDSPESEFFKKLNITIEGGTDPDSIISFLKSKGVKAEMKTLTQDELKEYINSNQPVIMCLQAWGEQEDYSNVYKEGHYITAIGYNDKGFIFEDPSISAKYGFISYSDLDERWHDVSKEGKKYNHLGIIIKCNKKYDPSKMEVIEGKLVENITENYLNYLYNPVCKRDIKDWRGHNLPVEGDDKPNWIRTCMTLETDRAKINCLRKLRELTAMNPFYQYRIDRFVDVITQNYEPSDKPGMIPEIQESADVDASLNEFFRRKKQPQVAEKDKTTMFVKWNVLLFYDLQHNDKKSFFIQKIKEAQVHWPQIVAILTRDYSKFKKQGLNMTIEQFRKAIIPSGIDILYGNNYGGIEINIGTEKGLSSKLGGHWITFRITSTNKLIPSYGIQG